MGPHLGEEGSERLVGAVGSLTLELWSAPVASHRGLGAVCQTHIGAVECTCSLTSELWSCRLQL